MSIQLNKRASIVNKIIQYRLENGHMPTSADIMQMIADENTVKVASNPTSTPVTLLDGQVMRAQHINDLTEGIEIDLLSMRATLDESWINLKNIVDKLEKSIPAVESEATLVKNTAIRALALIPQADAVRVGSEAINVSTGIGFGSIDGADMSLSSGVEVDLAAGAVTLERSAVSIIPASAGSWSVDGEYDVRVDKTIGSLSWTIDDDIARTWTLAISTPSKYGRVSVNSNYTIINKNFPLKRVEVVIPDYAETDVFVYVDYDGSGQYTFWEKANGKGRIIVDGQSVHASNVKIVFSRYVANGSFYQSSRPRHEYTFQIAEVIFSAASYTQEGNIVTDPIEMPSGGIISTVVDVDAVIPSTSYVNVYVAKNVEAPSSLSDFMWIPVDKKTNLTELSRISHNVETITAEAPIKVRTGAGVYSNSIYSIGEVDGVLARIEEGFDQVEVRSQTVYYENEADYPAVNALAWTGVQSTPRGCHDVLLEGGNYSKISTNIWADVSSSHPMNIQFENVDDYVVMLNGVNITQRISDGQISASFVSGKNDLIIYTKADPTADPRVIIPEIPGCTIAIDRPQIVQENALVTTENRAAQAGRSILINHDPTGRVFRVAVKTQNGDTVDFVRMRIELIRGLSGETPQVKSAYITTGV